MKRFPLLLSVVLCLVLTGCSGSSGVESGPAAAALPSVKVVEKQAGVSWVAGFREVTPADLQPLAEHHVRWIVQTPFAWQADAEKPEVLIKPRRGRALWGERDEGLEATTQLAKAQGVKTLLKPHLWVAGGSPRMEMGMSNDADWQTWFEGYSRYILHQAELAQRLGIEGLCVGTELHKAAVERPEDWRRLIGQVREVYDGQLTYAANWWREYEEITFWDALDFVGIQAYFPLSEADDPTLEELIAGWQPHLAAIEAVQRRTGKPILFTEIGYKSTVGGAARPWGSCEF